MLPLFAENAKKKYFFPKCFICKMVTQNHSDAEKTSSIKPSEEKAITNTSRSG